MLIRTWLIPVLAISGLAFAGWTVAKGAHPVPAAAPVAEPATAPFARSVAAAGLIEAAGENIAIGTPVGGLAVEVPATIGARVEAGDPLFRLDDRTERAELAVRAAALAVAEADLARLKASPRPEDLPPARARVAEAEAQLTDAARQLARYQAADASAVAPDELDRRRGAAQVAEARLAAARAELASLEAGAWAPDLAAAGARADEARARIAAAEAEVERLTVRAPAAGTVLQVKIRAGEYATPGALATPLVLLGDTSTLQVRVDVDENDAWRARPGAPAQATLRGNAAVRFPLEWVRHEPYVVPKRSLTGESTERVDTRVLQIVYRFTPGDRTLYVGQQVDVFIDEAAP